MIVESPSKIKSLSKYLGDEFLFEASMGHVRDLPSKAGRVETDKNFRMHYQVKSNSVIKKIREKAEEADVIYLATDPDREGEAIAWHIMEEVKKKLPNKDFNFKRVSFQSITKESVLSGMDSARDDVDEGLVNSQQARRALDYLLGFELSPLLWTRIPGAKSAGRVLSIALRMICEREKEVLEFLEKEFWDVSAKFEGVAPEALLTTLDGTKLEKFSLPDEEAATKAVAQVKTVSQYKVLSLKESMERRMPYPPFITSTLQQEAFAKLGFSPKKTMTVAQQLYENGFITYMRTDSIFITKPFIEEIRKYIDKKHGTDHLPEKEQIYSRKGNTQEAHEAIRVTSLDKQALADLDQRELYELIWKRTVACQMNPIVKKKSEPFWGAAMWSCNSMAQLSPLKVLLRYIRWS